MTATIAVLSLLLPPVAPPSPAVSQPRQPAVSVSAPIKATSWPPLAPAVLSGMADAAKWGRVTPRPAPTPFFDHPLKEVSWPAAVAVIAESPEPVPIAVAPTAEPKPLTLRERALNRFAELGAPAWVIAAFDCIGRVESGWRAVDSPPNWDGSVDRGPLQINSRWHDATLAALGLDPYDGVDAATYGMRLWRASGFSPWAERTRRLCGL